MKKKIRWKILLVLSGSLILLITIFDMGNTSPSKNHLILLFIAIILSIIGRIIK